MWLTVVLLPSLCGLILLQISLIEAWSGHFCNVRGVRYRWESYCSSRFLWWCSVYSQRMTLEVFHYIQCCEGWANNGFQDCNVPVCSPSCEMTGYCRAPGECPCTLGTATQYYHPACKNYYCSHLLPCYPGLCIYHDECICSIGFNGTGEDACLKMTKDNAMPVISLSTVTLAQVSRMDNTTKFSYSLDGTSKEKDSFWINQKDFNYLKFELNSIYIPPRSSFRPGSIYDAQLGIVEGHITANISKIPRSGEIRNMACLKEYRCPDISDMNPNQGIVDCVMTDNQFYTYIEHGDRLSVEFIAKNGGYRSLVDQSNDNVIWKTQMYQGLTDRIEVEFKFDLYVPIHCSESNSTTKCRITDVPVKIENEFTKFPINISWAGWEDDLSKIDHYHVEVFKLSPDPYDILQEMTPLYPVHSADFNHTHHGIYRYTYAPSECGMFSVLLQVSDKANNSKFARRFVLYDPTSNISLNTDDKLFVSSAEPETGYMWQVTKVGKTTEINVEWKNHFVNKFISEGKLLNKVNEYPIQFQDIQREGILQSSKFIFPGLDDNEGQRTVDEKPNKNGIVHFEAVMSFSDDTDEPRYGWFNISELAENFTFNETLKDGITARVWVRAHDVLGNTKSDKTEVHFDSSAPQVKNDSVVFYRNLENGTHIYTSRIVFEAADHESGVHKIELKLMQADTGYVQHNGSTSASQKNTSCSTDIDCRCVLEKCFVQHQVLDLDNCWFMASKEKLDHVNITLEVTVYNQAMLKTTFNVTVDKLNTLRGLEYDSGPTNIRVEKINANGVRLEWDLPKTESCYGRMDIVIILHMNDSSTKVYTVSRNTTFVDIIGLDPEKDYTAVFNLGYGEQRIRNMTFSFQTATKEVSVPTVVIKESVLGWNILYTIICALVGAVACIAVAVVILLCCRRSRTNKAIEQGKTKVQSHTDVQHVDNAEVYTEIVEDVCLELNDQPGVHSINRDKPLTTAESEIGQNTYMHLIKTEKNCRSSTTGWQNTSPQTRVIYPEYSISLPSSK